MATVTGEGAFAKQNPWVRSNGMLSPFAGRIQRNRLFLGTQLSPESRVYYYTCVEQKAAGIVARPEECCYSCGVLAGKAHLTGQHGGL